MGAILVICVGLIALLGGKIAITKELRIAGVAARLYGLALLLLVVPISFAAEFGFAALVRMGVLPNEPWLSLVVDSVAALGILALLALPFRILERRLAPPPTEPPVPSDQPRVSTTVAQSDGSSANG